MKADIARFVAHCDTCQRIKAEHQKPAGLLQPLPIPVWKWDEIGMDFVVDLPRTQKGHDSIHPIREGLNIAKSTQKFAPCRDSQNIVYPRICTQEDTSIDIYGYDLIS